MPIRSNRFQSFFGLTGILFIFVQASIAFAAELELSLETTDRRNQTGAVMVRVTGAVDFEVGEWEAASVLSAGQRAFESNDAAASIAPVLPLSLRRRLGPVGVHFGYDRLPDWGYGRTGALVLTSQAPPALQVGGAIDLGIAGYEKLIGILDSGEKYIFAHRARLRPTPQLEFTFSEVSIVSERAASVSHNYLPLWPVYLSQHLKLGGVTNDDINANMAVGGKWESPWGTFYGDLFVDDMPQSPSHHDAYLIAVQVGYLRPMELGGRAATLGIEYTRANNWMYTLRHLPYSYTHHGYVLGHWIGPDSDLLDVTATFPAPLALELSYRLIRHGEGKIGDVWEDYSTKHAREHDFLTGVVETSHWIRAAATRPFGSGWRISGEIGLGFASNADHVEGATELRGDFSLGLTYSW